MIYVALGFIILLVSFLIALISLIREQKQAQKASSQNPQMPLQSPNLYNQFQVPNSQPQTLLQDKLPQPFNSPAILPKPLVQQEVNTQPHQSYPQPQNFPWEQSKSTIVSSASPPPENDPRQKNLDQTAMNPPDKSLEGTILIPRRPTEE